MSEYGCKLCRVLDERGLADYDERMLAQWRGETGPRKGYRTLATDFNTTLLRREMDRAGVSTLGDEAESKYGRLTGDNEAVAREVREVLRGEGVPIDDLEADFVSYGAVRTHFKSCLEADYDPDISQTASDWERTTIDIARSTATEKTAEAVGALVSSGTLEIGGEPSIEVDISIECSSCHTRIPVDRAIRRGYVCRCDDSGDVSVHNV
jgi:hypothetical protein